MKKKISLLLALLMGLLLVFVGGCASGETGTEDNAEVTEESEVTEDESQEEAADTSTEEAEDDVDDLVIVVGSDGTTPGYSALTEEGELEGFEIDIWNEISERNDFQVEFVQMPFSSLFTLLEDGRIDVIANVITPTDERKAIYDFSDPYIFEEHILISAPDVEADTLADLDGMTGGATQGSVDDQVYDQLEEENDIAIERVYFNDTATNDVIAGNVDFSVQGQGTANDMMESIGEDKIKQLIGTGMFAETAYPFRKGESQDLIDMTNQTIAEMREDGTLSELSEKWFNADFSVVPDENKGAETEEE